MSDDSDKGGVGEALERDWEQTKSDLPGLDGKDLDQDVDDTVKAGHGRRAGSARRRAEPGLAASLGSPDARCARAPFLPSSCRED